ncbi:MAG: response regulator transcription factor [Acidimicrobiia bacterium]|nr:response regulator transcription factor [Acidimicrobiia bacterium]MDH5504719.1 response regulator transcription factor [Acidimicrobiia bacterium]
MQETILLVEDDDSIAEMLGQVFEKAGYRFRHCDSGEEAVIRIKTRPPSVVLLDIGLPGMDGLETCRQIRQISQLPVIMLTARDTEIDKVVGLEIGADDYVTKPFSPRELVARVKAVLRRSTETSIGQRVVEVDGWIIDVDRHHVRFGDGLPVTPTAKEFDLLWYLAENAGLVLTRAQLLEAVWGYDYFGETRTVDVHIRQIRKKLDGIPIETVWGVGYRFGTS